MALTLLVGVELVVLAVGIARVVPSTVAYVVAGVVAVVGLLLAVPSGSTSLGGGIVRRLVRGRDARVRRAEADAAGRAPLAVFPDVQVQQVRTPRGAVLGAAQWSGTVVAALSVGRHADAGRVAGAQSLPLGRLRSRLRDAGLPLESFAVVDRGAEGEGRRVLALRLRPEDAPGAVEARGGGSRGVLATISSAVALATAVLAEHGVDAHALDREALLAEIAAECDPAGRVDGTAVWQGAWSGVVGPVVSHRALVAREVSGTADLAALVASGDVARRVVLEVGCEAVLPPVVAASRVVAPAAPAPAAGPDDAAGGPAAPGATAPQRATQHAPVRVLVRLLDESPAALDAAAASLGSLPGMRLVPVVDETLDAVRATTLLGSGRRRPARSAAASSGPLDSWLEAPVADLDHTL